MERLTYRDYEQISVKGLDIVGIGEKNADILSRAIEKLSYYEDLEEQGLINNNQWISVKDALPEDYVNVLTCDKRGNIHIFSHCKGYEYPFCIPPDHTRYYMPVAWQPLPQPVKEADSK